MSHSNQTPIGMPGITLIEGAERRELAGDQILRHAVAVPAEVARFEGQVAVFLEDLFADCKAAQLQCKSGRGETYLISAPNLKNFSLLGTNSPSWKLVPAGRAQLDEITIPRFLLRDVASIEFGDGFDQEESSDLVFTNLTDALGRPKSVRFLNLTSAWLESFPSGILELVNLESLNLGKNKIEQLPEEIGELKNLRVLKLSRNRIRCLPDEIGRLKQLTELHASHNEIAELPKKFWNLEKLQLLNLGRNKLVQIPEEIKQLKNLRTLELDKNPIPKGDRTTVANWLPQVTIEW